MWSQTYFCPLYLGNAGNAKKAMICVLLGNFVLMLILFVSFVAVTPELVKYGLVVILPGGIMEQIVAANSQSQVTILTNLYSWLSNVIPFIADIVIVWRAWALWTNNTKVKWTLLLLTFADIAVSLADSVVHSTVFQRRSNESAISLDWVAVILSLSVNLIATCSIAFQAWLHYKSMNSISSRRRQTRGERILLLLLESGAVYMAVQLLAIITVALSVNASVASTINFVDSLIFEFYIFAASLNPVIIFILVQTQNTYDQSFHLEEMLTLSQQVQLQ
ncbi:hypothetical protein BDP27DRAFT_377037 [Rhodocollybia butyracea]|uniref:Uncharacterized protein n=1 Tax=Rhodocollybia butyracea TaxID=206335 RepID=A0A9P5TZT6_9AGAR|nr:hypothetical protein BDP27DRAFT_377037 [Rhodocollybia butyracea]